MRVRVSVIFILFFLITPIFGQAKSPLPVSFEKFILGMSLVDLKKALNDSSYFLYRGDPDVTMLSRPNTSLIDVPGITYVTRGVFQLVDGKLYSMAFDLSPVEFDYFTLYTTLSKKYGDPNSLDPSIARWEDSHIRLSLEKPLTVKYIDLPVFQKIQNESRTRESIQKITREKFLENF